jgi:hypothetical protein
MLSKSKIQDTIDSLDDEINIDEFIERLILIEKIEEANKESMEGNTISHEKLKKEIAEWFA